jgi:hypothetical protein
MRSRKSGAGLSKMTKALRPKRPALIPMLDTVVQKYLVRGYATWTTTRPGWRLTGLSPHGRESHPRSVRNRRVGSVCAGR